MQKIYQILLMTFQMIKKCKYNKNRLVEKLIYFLFVLIDNQLFLGYNKIDKNYGGGFMKLDLKLKKLKRSIYYFNISEFSFGFYLVLFTFIAMTLINILLEMLQVDYVVR